MNEQKKYRLAHPDKVKQYKQNEKKRSQEYRNEHREEKTLKERLQNQQSQLTATKARKAWTKEDINRLGQLIDKGKSYAQIAEELKRSIKSVNNAKQKYFPDKITEYKTRHYVTY